MSVINLVLTFFTLYCSLIHNLTNWFSLQAEQDVPDFLEECAEQAIGTNFGPEGGQFASKDIRVSIVKLTCCFKSSANASSFSNISFTS